MLNNGEDNTSASYFLPGETLSVKNGLQPVGLLAKGVQWKPPNNSPAIKPIGCSPQT